MNLQEMRAAARDTADEEASGFVSDTSLDRSINQGNRFFYNKIVAAYERYFEVEGDLSNGGLISVVPNTNRYAFPDTMQKLVKVQWRSAGDTNENNWRRLRRIDVPAEQSATDYFYPVRTGYVDGAFGYEPIGQYLYIRPMPQIAFDVKLTFIPRATTLTSLTDVSTVPIEFHELICDFAALRILGKSGEDIFGELRNMFDMQMQTFLETVPNRVQEPQVMNITEYEDTGW